MPASRFSPAGGSAASRRGFTLLELIIVLSIVALVSTLLIPAVSGMMQKANQRATMAEMRTLGGALLAWELERAGTGAVVEEGGALDTEKLRAMLVPEYLEKLRPVDAWKRPLRVLRGSAERDGYRFLLWSAGRDGLFEELAEGPFPTTDFDRDIVWSDGGFLTWPEAEAEKDGT